VPFICAALRKEKKREAEKDDADVVTFSLPTTMTHPSVLNTLDKDGTLFPFSFSPFLFLLRFFFLPLSLITLYYLFIIPFLSPSSTSFHKHKQTIRFSHVSVFILSSFSRLHFYTSKLKFKL
jgi:hypothetical protein